MNLEITDNKTFLIIGGLLLYSTYQNYLLKNMVKEQNDLIYQTYRIICSK